MDVLPPDEAPDPEEPELDLGGELETAGLLPPEGVVVLTDGEGVLRVGVVVLTEGEGVLLPDLLSGLLYVALLAGLVYEELPPDELLPCGLTLLV